MQLAQLVLEEIKPVFDVFAKLVDRCVDGLGLLLNERRDMGKRVVELLLVDHGRKIAKDRSVSENRSDFGENCGVLEDLEDTTHNLRGNARRREAREEREPE